MNNKYVFIILAPFGLALIIIFAAWILVGQGVIKPESIGLKDVEPSNPTTIFPSGESENISGTPTNNPDQSTSTENTINLDDSSSTPRSQLSKIETKPLGSLLAIGKSTSTILFFEKQTGHLYQLSSVGIPLRLSNTTIPKLLAAEGGVNGTTTSLVIKSDKGRPDYQLASLATKLGDGSSALFLNNEEMTEQSLYPLQLKPLPSSVIDFAVSPAGDLVAYLEKVGSGTDLIIANWPNTSREKVLSLPLTEISLSWPASTTIALQTKPSAQADGFLYLYHTKTKKVERVLYGVKGLISKLSPDGHYLLYSGGGENSMFLGLYDRRNKNLSRLPLRTLADKCIWSKDSSQIYCGAPAKPTSGTYPDDWYLGLTSFADNLWKIEVNNKQATLLFNPELNNLGTEIDAINLLLDETGKRFLFINKKDSTLWQLDLESGF